MKQILLLVLVPVAFLVGTMGSDLMARTSIGGETLVHAAADHLHWATVQPIGTVLLFVPFLAVGLVSAAVDKWGRTRSAVLIFATATVTLLYFYWRGFQDAQHALLAKEWTASALSVGLLPFAIGVPVVIAFALIGTLAIGLHRRTKN